MRENWSGGKSDTLKAKVIYRLAWGRNKVSVFKLTFACFNFFGLAYTRHLVSCELNDRIGTCHINIKNKSKISCHYMDILHRSKYICEYDHEKFQNYEELIAHTKRVHHHPIVKCRECGKEFIHEKDRLHHVREEHEQKEDYRTHKDSYKTKKIGIPQDQVDESTRNFGDNF